MKVYQVGGCIRDELLGITPKDYDYVVVGGTEEEMLKRGFTRVGAGFPVFLHPKTGEEYALARKERKVGVGYNGFETVFDPSVTLEEDLARRDLTINAMAKDPDTGDLIDPYGGRQDLDAGWLRHVSDAFAEDPVRVLRTARFRARYGFEIVDETLALMGTVVPELNFVPQERIWAEFEKGLMEQHPQWMLATLDIVGALDVEALQAFKCFDFESLMACGKYGDMSVPLYARFTACAAAFSKDDYAKHCVPTDISRVSAAFYDSYSALCHYDTLSAEDRVKMFERLRFFSSPTLYEQVIQCLKIAVVRGVTVESIVAALAKDIARLQTVQIGPILESTTNGKEIGQKLHAARVAALS